MTTITVVAATIDGKVVYLRSNSIFGPAPVEDPVKAEDFTDRPLDLEHFLADLVLPGDSCFAKSGLRVDGVPLVSIFEVTSNLTSTRVGREPRL